MRGMISIVLVIVCWWLISLAAGPVLIPTPVQTAQELYILLTGMEGWRNISITFARGVIGLSVAAVCALLLGIPCGLSRWGMDVISPVISAVQGCPPVLWIALLMVWVGIGSLVPVAAIFVATFPVLFLNTAEGVSALDRRLFLMARLYHVPRRRVLRRIIVPGIYAYLLAGFSFALGICWKVTATAEFIGSSSGIGSEIYWSFRYLDMPRLFAWAVVLVTFGVVLERLIIRPMRRSVQRRRHGDD